MKHNLIIILAALCLTSASSAENSCTQSETTAKGTKAPAGPFCSGDLIFEENFNELDTSLWKHEITMGGGGNWEFQVYNAEPSSSFVENGNLIIRPILLAEEHGADFLTTATIDLHDKCTNDMWWGCKRTGSPDNILPPIQSARLNTKNTFSFKYGKVEINAKMPGGDWIQPALWLLPNDEVYGGWPLSGEIDIVETRGNKELMKNGVNMGTEQMGSTLHFGPRPDVNGWETAHGTRNLPAGSGWDDNFHKYQMEWSPERLRFSVDDLEVKNIEVGSGFWKRGNFDKRQSGTNIWANGGKAAPFDQEFYFIINLAVGGTSYFPDDAVNKNGAKPWANNSPGAATKFWNGKDQWYSSWQTKENDGKHSSLQVDYVKVWAL